jgi:hypothetical protein
MPLPEKEGIKTSDQEFDRHFGVIAVQQKIKPQKLAQQLKDNGTIYQIQEEIMNGKVIDLLEEKAKVTEIDPKPEEEHTHSHEHGDESGHDHSH